MRIMRNTTTTYSSESLGCLLRLMKLSVVLLKCMTGTTAFILTTTSKNKISSYSSPYLTAFTITTRTRSTTTPPLSSVSSSHRLNLQQQYSHPYRRQSTTAAAVAVPYSCQSNRRRASLILQCTITSSENNISNNNNSNNQEKDNVEPTSFQNKAQSSSPTTTTTTELPGKHKWLGGAVDPTDGSIYGIPSNANDVICLYDSSLSNVVDRTEDEPKIGVGEGGQPPPQSYQIQKVALPPSVAKGKFKWLRGIVCDGYLYGIPAWSKDGVLKVNLAKLKTARRRAKMEAEIKVDGAAPEDNTTNDDNHTDDDDIITILPLPPILTTERDDTNDLDLPPPPTRWLWHGAALNQNHTAIYCIPSNAHDVLKIDLESSTTSLLTVPKSATPPAQTNKWYGGILGMDNSVYGIPYAASGVLKIDANTDTITLLGDYGVQKYNWHGGTICPTTGSIYAFPSHHDHVMKVDTNGDDNDDDDDDNDGISLLEIHRPSYDVDEVTRYKWLGGCLGVDGNVYGMPSDASSILRINTKTDYVTTFGVVSGEKNKWQGGVLARDGRIYAIPSNARNVLCLDTTTGNKKNGTNDDDNKEQKPGNDDKSMYSIELLGDLPPSKDKWQGGFIGNDGAIYCIPENFNQIMKVTPKGRNSTIDFL